MSRAERNDVMFVATMVEIRNPEDQPAPISSDPELFYPPPRLKTDLSWCRDALIMAEEDHATKVLPKPHRCNDRVEDIVQVGNGAV